MTKSAFILNFLKLYNLIWHLVRPLLRKNRRLKPGFEKRISTAHLKKADIWIQAASAGEAYLAVRLIEALAKSRIQGQRPKLLVTSITEQGMDILKRHLDTEEIRKSIELSIQWSPFDQPDIISRAVGIVNPGAMVLLETEIWPGLLWSLKQNKSRIYIINARLSAGSFSIYHKTRFLWQHLAPDTILATSNRDADRYRHIFKKADVRTMSNIKFETMGGDDRHEDKEIRKDILSFLPEKTPLTILASVRTAEEKQVRKILSSVLQGFPDQTVAVFPRHMHRISAWEKQLSGLGIAYTLRSRIKKPLQPGQVLLWDTFGELKIACDFADVVFMGGSLKPLGGQNFIEPAAAGAVTVTGPFYDDFAWVGDQIFKQGIVIKNQTADEVSNTILEALGAPNSKSRDIRRELTVSYIRARQGGTLQAGLEILKAFDGSL